MNKNLLWLICRFAMGVLVILTFTPVVIPSTIYEPMLFNMPYTLWAGIMIALSMVLLTYIGTRVHPGRND